MAQKIYVQDIEVRLLFDKKENYICITDIAKKFGGTPADIIKAWMRNRNTVEFLGVWEQIHNAQFNMVGFDHVKSNTGLGSFILTVKEWIAQTNAIGMLAKAGRYGGTYAHQDIALEFCSYVSPVFKLYFVKEFQRLKIEESKQLDTEWNIRRIIAKTNYHIQANAIRENLVPVIEWNTSREGLKFASEADLLNVAIFGMTAKEWRQSNNNKKGNMRDFATPEQLIILANLESMNAELIREGLSQDERVVKLNEIAIYQMRVLASLPTLKELPDGN